MKPAPVLIQLAQPSSIKASSEPQHQGGRSALPSAGEMLNSCTCPSSPEPALIRPGNIYTKMQQDSFYFSSVSTMLVLHKPTAHLLVLGRMNSSAKEAHTVQADSPMSQRQEWD